MQQQGKQLSIFIVLITILSLLVGLTSLECYKIQTQVAQLHELQDLYRTYVSTLKMIIDNYQEAYGDAECYTFEPVNRTPDYLWQATADFFKAHDLDLVLSGFDQGEWQDYTSYMLEKSEDTQNQVSATKSSVATKKLHKKNDVRHAPYRRKIQGTVHAGNQLLWPIPRSNFWLSSPFGPRRKRDGSRGFHHGIDMAAVKGTAVKAARSGTVIEACHRPGWGNTVLIEHANGLKTRYAHLHKIYVAKGKSVTTATTIGEVGETGYIRKRTKDGSHLHFEVYDNGKTVDPLSVLPSLYL